MVRDVFLRRVVRPVGVVHGRVGAAVERLLLVHLRLTRTRGGQVQGAVDAALLGAAALEDKCADEEEDNGAKDGGTDDDVGLLAG